MLHMPIRSYTLAIDYTWRSILDPISSINDIRYALGVNITSQKLFVSQKPIWLCILDSGILSLSVHLWKSTSRLSGSDWRTIKIHPTNMWFYTYSLSMCMYIYIRLLQTSYRVCFFIFLSLYKHHINNAFRYISFSSS